LWATVGACVRADCNEKLVVAHNFFGRVQAFAVSYNQKQAARPMGGRTGLSRANVTVNNIFYPVLPPSQPRPARAKPLRRKLLRRGRRSLLLRHRAARSGLLAESHRLAGVLRPGRKFHARKDGDQFRRGEFPIAVALRRPAAPPQPTGLPGENAMAPSVGPAGLAPNAVEPEEELPWLSGLSHHVSIGPEPDFRKRKLDQRRAFSAWIGAMCLDHSGLAIGKDGPG